MQGWFDFFINVISGLVTTIFSLQLGLGFSLGDAFLALMIVSIAASIILRVNAK